MRTSCRQFSTGNVCAVIVAINCGAALMIRNKQRQQFNDGRGVATSKEDKAQLFEEQTVRTHRDEEEERWYFSIVDVVAVLTESPRPRKYWNALKTKR